MSDNREAYCRHCKRRHWFGYDEVGAQTHLLCCSPIEPHESDPAIIEVDDGTALETSEGIARLIAQAAIGRVFLLQTMKHEALNNVMVRKPWAISMIAHNLRLPESTIRTALGETP